MYNGLSLHCGASEVIRDKIYEVITPEATETHFPVPHTLLLENVEHNLAQNGYEIVKQAHALTQKGQRYFGLIEVQKSGLVGLDDPSVHPDYNLVIGLRNTHDLSYAAALCMGNRVFICDNLAFSGEVLIGRRHTRYIARDIPLMIPRAFGALSVERVNMEKRIEAYKTAQISDKDANDFIVRSIVDEGIFPSRNLSRIVQEWRNPAHEEFAPRTVWSLFNAYTEVAKPSVEVGEGGEVIHGGNVATLMGRTKNLYGFFDKTLGISLQTREEVLASGAGEDIVTGIAAASHS